MGEEILVITAEPVKKQFRHANLQSSTAARALAACGVGGNRGDIFDAANLETGTSESAEGRLRARARGLGSVTPSSSDLHVDGGNTQLLGSDSSVSGSKHGGIGRSLVTVSLDLHATSNTHKCFTSGKISDVLQYQ